MTNARVVRLYHRGWSSQQIADQFGCSRRTVCNRLERAGVPRTGNGLGRGNHKNQVLSAAQQREVIRLYVEEKLSCNRIKDRMGCSIFPIRRILHRAGIAMRSNGFYNVPSRARTMQHVRTGRLVRFDSQWERAVYDLLHARYGGEVLFQGEFGIRHHRRTPVISLNRETPSSSGQTTYCWHPDFIIPSRLLIVEVKGHWVARQTWDTIIQPAIDNTDIEWDVYLWDHDPSKGSDLFDAYVA